MAAWWSRTPKARRPTPASRRGDVILGVNGRNVKTMKDLRDATAKAGKTVALLIQRQDAQIFVPLRLP